MFFFLVFGAWGVVFFLCLPWLSGPPWMRVQLNVSRCTVNFALYGYSVRIGWRAASSAAPQAIRAELSIISCQYGEGILSMCLVKGLPFLATPQLGTMHVVVVVSFCGLSLFFRAFSFCVPIDGDGATLCLDREWAHKR